MDQNLTPYQRQAPKAIARAIRDICVLAGVLYGLYALVLAPIYTQLSADVVYQDHIITIILAYLLPALDICVYVGVYAAVIYAIWRGGVGKAWRAPVAFVLLTLGKYLLNFFMTCLTDGGFPSFSSFVEDDLVIMGEAFLLEMLQFGLVVLIASVIRHKRVTKHQLAMLSERHPVDERVLAFPMKGMLSAKNPVQWATFWTAIVLLVGRVYMHLVYQLALLVYNGETDGLAVILFDLGSDLLIAGGAYFVMILLLSYFDRKDVEELAGK